MSRAPDAATLLERALLAGARAAGCLMRLAESESTPWASVTFTGARHRLVLTGERSPALETWLAGLPEAEVALRGHLVADLGVVRLVRTDKELTAVLEVLTVEAR